MIINDFRGDDCEISEEEVLRILKGIYEGTVYAEYLAASLCYCYKVSDHPKGYEDYLIIFQPNLPLTEELDYWVAKLYVQNKSEDAHYWKASQITIKNYEEKM